MQGKVVFVTGASRGIGLATARLFFSKGATVIGTYRANKPAVDFELVELDVTNGEQVSSVITSIVEKYGRIDILVNNAGITDDVTLKNMNDEQWENVLKVNLGGCYRVSKEALGHGVCSIVNVSSIAGIIGHIGQTNYSASKAGIIGFSKSLAREVARKGIRVNVVAPGLIDTDMTKKIPEEILGRVIPHIPLQRMGTAEEVASLIVFLASEEASYITGQVFHVNGGLI